MEQIFSIISIFILIISSIGLDRALSLRYVVLLAIILSLLPLTGYKHLTKISLISYMVFLLFLPEIIYFLPLIVYISTISKDSFRYLIVIPLLYAYMQGEIFTLSFSLLTYIMGYIWKNKYLIERENFTLKDSLRENQFLASMIKKEGEKNTENQVEIALLNERNRISRRLHDSIGHTISSSLIQLEALKTIVNEGALPILDKMEDNLSKGMNDIRDTLHSINIKAFNLEDSIKRVIETYQNKYYIDFIYQMEESSSQNFRKSILNIIKEALNNVRKHSDANKISIIVRELPNHYTISVKDNGSKKKGEIKEGPGLGLTGFREIARTYKGYFNYGYDGGFYIHLTIPKENINEGNNN